MTRVLLLLLLQLRHGEYFFPPFPLAVIDLRFYGKPLTASVFISLMFPVLIAV
jgi:hypothetical protein